MKKYFLMSALAAFAAIATISCDNNDNDSGQYTDNDTYSQMKDITGSFSASNSYAINQSIAIPASDVVLIYRNVNSNKSNTTPVWQLLPKTFYLDGGHEIDYNFVFSTQRVQITTEANFDQSTMSAADKDTYLNNQTFRIVLVPASTGKNSNVNYNDYNSVIKFYNLTEPKLK